MIKGSKISPWSLFIRGPENSLERTAEKKHGLSPYNLDCVPMITAVRNSKEQFVNQHNMLRSTPFRTHIKKTDFKKVDFQIIKKKLNFKLKKLTFKLKMLNFKLKKLNFKLKKGDFHIVKN